MLTRLILFFGFSVLVGSFVFYGDELTQNQDSVSFASSQKEEPKSK